MIYEIGRHKVRHGDVHEQAEISKLTMGVKADIFYSDPPWGAGNIKYWDTMNKKMNGITESTGNFNVDIFLGVVLDNAMKHTDGWVVIEYGKRWVDKVKAMAKERGLVYCGQVETLYSGTNVMEIIFFRTDSAQPIDLTGIYHLTGYKCVKEIFKLLKPTDGGIGMDLCCGMGYTAQACIDNGLQFVGNELNKKRLDKTIVRLNKSIN
jgi:predicted methyltransferase